MGKRLSPESHLYLNHLLSFISTNMEMLFAKTYIIMSSLCRQKDTLPYTDIPRGQGPCLPSKALLLWRQKKKIFKGGGN